MGNRFGIGLNKSARGMRRKPFERSNGLDTVLYKNMLLQNKRPMWSARKQLYTPDTVRSQRHTHLVHVFPEFSCLGREMLYATGRLEGQRCAVTLNDASARGRLTKLCT